MSLLHQVTNIKCYSCNNMIEIRTVMGNKSLNSINTINLYCPECENYFGDLTVAGVVSLEKKNKYSC